MSDTKEQRKVYLWKSTGGCERCESMDGYHVDSEPKRPHPNCDCEILLVKSKNKWKGRYNSKHCFEMVIRYLNPIHKKTNPKGTDTFQMVYEYVIFCIDGARQIKGKIKITQPYKPWWGGKLEENFKKADGLVFDKVGAIAKDKCKCGQPANIA